MVGERERLLREDLETISCKDLAFLDGKRVFVTGSTGFIGSLLVRRLLLARVDGINVEVVASARSMGKLEALADELGADAGLTLNVCDLTCDPIREAGHIDFICHAASVTSSMVMATHPYDVIRTNISGMEKMIDLARDKEAKLVFLSSMEVYGTRDVEGYTDEPEQGFVDQMRPRSCYPVSKQLCESMCACAHAQFGAEAVVARLAQTFGIGVPNSDNRAYAQFIRKALVGEDIVLHTSGMSEGNYVYSTDALRGIFTLMREGLSGEAYNVVNEDSHMTIRSMAELCAEVGGKGSRVVFEKPSFDYGYAPDVHLHLSNRKLRSLGWFPRIGMRESLLKLASYIMHEENESCVS